MKREFLQNFKVGENSLPKEIIDAIMEQNGMDIQQAKQCADVWENKYNQAVTAHALELEKMRLESNLAAAVQRTGGRSVKAITAMLDMEEIAKAQDIPQALDAALGELRKENGWLFDQPTPPPYARFTGSVSGGESEPVTLAGALRERMNKTD